MCMCACTNESKFAGASTANTVLPTVHQPRFQIPELIDRIVLLFGRPHSPRQAPSSSREKLDFACVHIPNHANVIVYTCNRRHRRHRLNMQSVVSGMEQQRRQLKEGIF